LLILKGIPMPLPIARLSLAMLALAGLVACGKKTASEPLLTELAPAQWANAAAKIVDTKGADIGNVVFANGPGGVLMRVDVEGLSPGWHGIHLHMVADCSDGAEGFKKSGGHINPDNLEHGLLHPNGAHRADIPNIYAGADGRATAEIYRAGVNLYPSEAGAAENGPFPLMDDDGFAVIIHANADDHMTQPIGGAGDRVACAAVKG
jgi:Cu-Zn family superoxide dismutase